MVSTTIRELMVWAKRLLYAANGKRFVEEVSTLVATRELSDMRVKFAEVSRLVSEQACKAAWATARESQLLFAANLLSGEINMP